MTELSSPGDATLFRGKVVKRKDLAPIPLAHSRLAYNYIWVREDDGDVPVLIGDGGRFRVDLVGYAIVPLEVWNGLAELAEKAASDEASTLLEAIRLRSQPAPARAHGRLRAWRSALARWIAPAD